MWLFSSLFSSSGVCCGCLGLHPCCIVGGCRVWLFSSFFSVRGVYIGVLLVLRFCFLLSDDGVVAASVFGGEIC